jgi:hypothetical protein
MAPKPLPPGHSRSSSGCSEDNLSQQDVPQNVTGDSNTKGGGPAEVSASSSLPNYSLPQWLQGSNERHQVTKFKLTFPPVMQETRKVIEQYVRQNSSTFLKESTRASHQLRELQREEDEAQRKVGVAQEKLDRALASKADDLKKMRKEKQKANTKKLHELERQMRQQHAKEYKKAEARMQEETRLNFEKTYEEERSRKRQREEEENQKEGDDGDKKTDEDGVGLPASKKPKTTDGKDVDETSASIATVDPAFGDKNEALAAGPSNDDDGNKIPESKVVRIKIDELEKKREKVQTELDRLNERKKGKLVILLLGWYAYFLPCQVA